MITHSAAIIKSKYIPADGHQDQYTVNFNTIRAFEEEGEFFYYEIVPSQYQHPNPPKTLKIQSTLSMYHQISHGTCVIAPQNQTDFCKSKFVPFSSISCNKLQGWQIFFCFFLDWTKFRAIVESFGRYCLVKHLEAMIQKCKYRAEDKAASFREAKNWIATHLQELTHGIFSHIVEVLLNNNLPSTAHVRFLYETLLLPTEKPRTITVMKQS
ncbi:hypothetical protein VP01_938g5 [Puccinia sorghi]|uniref:Tet-like 2OG-Fe(II) oxygenase domain-containing protein n=1 Tax=Puccinia sorghi TaxID=27349 RepID=A0A0L6U7A5_9BASI|nr:hypothetical protein VP01_938g5 [Puccinia sorghi]